MGCELMVVVLDAFFTSSLCRPKIIAVLGLPLETVVIAQAQNDVLGLAGTGTMAMGCALGCPSYPAHMAMSDEKTPRPGRGSWERA